MSPRQTEKLMIKQQLRDQLAEIEKLLLVMDRDIALGEIAMIEWWAKKKYSELKKLEVEEAMRRFQ